MAGGGRNVPLQRGLGGTTAGRAGQIIVGGYTRALGQVSLTPPPCPPCAPQSSELRPVPGPRKLACLAALLLFLAFNLGPFRWVSEVGGGPPRLHSPP